MFVLLYFEEVSPSWASHLITACNVKKKKLDVAQFSRMWNEVKNVKNNQCVSTWYLTVRTLPAVNINYEFMCLLCETGSSIQPTVPPYSLYLPKPKHPLTSSTYLPPQSSVWPPQCLAARSSCNNCLPPVNSLHVCSSDTPLLHTPVLQYTWAVTKEKHEKKRQTCSNLDWHVFLLMLRVKLKWIFIAVSVYFLNYAAATRLAN